MTLLAIRILTSPEGGDGLISSLSVFLKPFTISYIHTHMFNYILTLKKFLNPYILTASATERLLSLDNILKEILQNG